MRPVRIALLAACAAFLAPALAHAQFVEEAKIALWDKVVVVHYEAVGEFRQKHVQIPPTDADLYGDVFERVTVSFDWDRKKKALVGKPTFRNDPGQVTNLFGMDRKCPTGKLNGAYEHFDAVEVKHAGGEAPLELVGKRIHPETMVAESCGNKLRRYKGATKPVTEYLLAVDPKALAFKGMGDAGGIRVTPDGKSIVIGAQNSGWTWTYTPTPR